MWTQYRRTLLRIQAVIAVVTCAALIATGFRAPAATVFFVVMQLGAVVGAMWGARIRGMAPVSGITGITDNSRAS
jgi:hypothetical protein